LCGSAQACGGGSNGVDPSPVAAAAAADLAAGGFNFTGTVSYGGAPLRGASSKLTASGRYEASDRLLVDQDDGRIKLRFVRLPTGLYVRGDGQGFRRGPPEDADVWDVGRVLREVTATGRVTSIRRTT